MQNEYSTGELFQSAALCDSHGEMSMSMLETRFIVAATLHANKLGVGYEDLIKDNNAWVLSRMSIETKRTPRINEKYSIVTWIESFNRHLSERNFALLDTAGNPMGYGRSVWACINIETRRPASLTPVVHIGERECPIEKQGRMGSVVEAAKVVKGQFRYSDIDFNGHVNSARYVEHLFDAIGADYLDGHRCRRIDIAYLHEAKCGMEYEIKMTGNPEGGVSNFDAELLGGGQAICRSRFQFEPREK